MALAENVRSNLSRFLSDRGISQRELAERSGVHYVTINRILNGQDPTLSVCEKLARALGLPSAIALFLQEESVAS